MGATDIPNIPDPLWPEGVVPTHLSVADMRDMNVVETFTGIVGGIWTCAKCGSAASQSPSDARYCITCVDRESQNSALAKKTNSNWMEQSTELGLSLFERQPEESDNEWRIWCKYREFYPRKLPTWSELALICESSPSTVIKVASKWSYKVRLVAWARFTDDGMQEKRVAAIKEMNVKQLTMAQTIQEKLAKAIELIQPETLRPGEIVNLFKVATELERRIVTYVDEKVDDEATDKRAKQVSLTKPEDIGDIIGILQKAGMLDGKTLGIEQTTRIVAKETELC